MFTVYDTDKNEFIEVAEPDPSLSYTYADYLKWNFEERLELFRGKIFWLSASNTRHQIVAGNIFMLFSNILKNEKCKTFIGPFDVRLLGKNRIRDNEVTTVVQPDLCIVCDDSKIDDKGCCGAPGLIVEILSPGNSKKELDIKYELYEEAGVREYWLVYPTEESVLVFVLNEQGKYEVTKPYTADETIISRIIPGLALNTNDIFTK